ncbi:PIN domain-containing protein [Chthoniobacter flavus]|uniref:PIN domain-containing protein n=1 Tax=Chthoniobacter flavus TaxID=191863 RepID=UPI0005B26E84
MSFLLDVNLLLACGWQTHVEHARALAWLDGQSEFYTCALVELGFIRVSMGPGFRALFTDTLPALREIKSRSSARTIEVDLDVIQLPIVSSHSDVTDAYLVSLARSHGLQLATLDAPLIAKAWATGVAVRPF